MVPIIKQGDMIMMVKYKLQTECIDEIFVESFNKAINNPENRNGDDLIWDYVNADMHLDLKSEPSDDINFAFEILADVYMEAA